MPSIKSEPLTPRQNSRQSKKVKKRPEFNHEGDKGTEQRIRRAIKEMGITDRVEITSSVMAPYGGGAHTLTTVTVIKDATEWTTERAFVDVWQTTRAYGKVESVRRVSRGDGDAYAA